MLQGHVLQAIGSSVAILLWAEEESFGVFSILRAEPHSEYSVIRHVHIELDCAVPEDQVLHIDCPLADLKHSIESVISKRERSIAG
jgi:hypothetical protein